MGKGDKRRPTLIDERTFGSNWCRAVGHKMRETHEVCINCGMTAQQIEEEANVRRPKIRKSR